MDIESPVSPRNNSGSDDNGQQGHHGQDGGYRQDSRGGARGRGYYPRGGGFPRAGGPPGYSRGGAPPGSYPAPPQTSGGCSTIVVQGLPSDTTPREFAVLFRFANGFVKTWLDQRNNVGYAAFDRPENAHRVRDFLNNQPFCLDHSSNRLAVHIAEKELEDIQRGQGTNSAPPAPMGSYGASNAPASNPDMAYRGMPQMKRGRGEGSGYDSSNVYVAGIPQGMEEGELRSIFSAFGAIQRVDYQPRTDDRGNIAFVHYDSVQEANAAISAMNGHNINGATLVVRAHLSHRRAAPFGGMMPPRGGMYRGGFMGAPVPGAPYGAPPPAPYGSYPPRGGMGAPPPGSYGGAMMGGGGGYPAPAHPRY